MPLVRQRRVRAGRARGAVRKDRDSEYVSQLLDENPRSEGGRWRVRSHLSDAPGVKACCRAREHDRGPRGDVETNVVDIACWVERNVEVDD